MDDFYKITEASSLYDQLENKSVRELLTDINHEDQKVALAVQKALPAIERCTNKVLEQLKKGGRLFYIGAGTSGRLGILDASECPPTFGVSPDKVIGLIAGGDAAIRVAVENAEDDRQQAFKDLEAYGVNSNDFVIGIAASGTTPYVLGGIDICNQKNIPTGGITCNPRSPLALTAQFPIEVVVGPEYVTGSSRMKAGTAQKMVLNMISTTTMIQLGHIKGNKMVDMQLSNAKLVERGVRLIREHTEWPAEKAKRELLQKGSVRKVLESYNRENGREENK